MTVKTPIFGIEYLVQGEPMRNTRLALENNAKTIEAALAKGPASPPAAQDLLTEAGTRATADTALDNRLKVLELRPGKRLYKPAATPTQSIGAAWTLLTWESRETNACSAGIFSSTNPGRLVAPRAGRYRATLTMPSNLSTSAPRNLQFRSQLAATSAPTATTGTMLTGMVMPAITGLLVQQLVADEFVMAAGDYVEAYAFSSGVPFGTQNGYDASVSLSYVGTVA